ncbi:MAG: 5-(carboxyamino)imidazole ribonucleotide mutase [Myxococcales bacterium]|nr:5-(carboxyamino)imidazole ribonucleotide mutase [Myxococcales bacterium]
MSSEPKVAILIGSPNDRSVFEGALQTLAKLDIPHELVVRSAHRTPAETMSYIQDAEKRGVQVFIAGAGMAAHLAGAVAAHTTKPVIGVPVASGPLLGTDALLSTVQMPTGIPVATVAINGSKNAAYLAAQMLGLVDAEVAARVVADRKERASAVLDEPITRG